MNQEEDIINKILSDLAEEELEEETAKKDKRRDKELSPNQLRIYDYIFNSKEG